MKLFNSTDRPLTVHVEPAITGGIEVTDRGGLDQVIVAPGRPATGRCRSAPRPWGRRGRIEARRSTPRQPGAAPSGADCTRRAAAAHHVALLAVRPASRFTTTC